MSATHCDQHQQAFVWKPAGISKRTGQPYNAFQACPVMNCRERPAKANGGFLAAPQTQLEPRTAPSAPAPLPGASGGTGGPDERSRLIVAQVAMKAAVELSRDSDIEVTFALAERIYREIFMLANMDPAEPGLPAF